MKNKILKELLKNETEKIEIPLRKEVFESPIERKPISSQNLKKKPSFFPIFASIVSCCLIIFCCIFVFSQKSQSQLTSYILQINPELCITTNQDDKVVNICSLSDEADDLLDDSAFDNIIGSDFCDCLGLIVNSIDNNIFQNYGNKKIRLYALNDNPVTLDKKLLQFGNYMREKLDDKGFSNIEFEKQNMTIDFFKEKMEFNGDFNSLDDMRKEIENHRRFFNANRI